MGNRIKASSVRNRIEVSEEDVFRARKAGELVKRRKRPTLIDLFSGAGGMTLGFTEDFGHCFVPIWANDINEDAVTTYNLNFDSHCIAGDLLDILSTASYKIPSADVVIGGPPCQGFSLLNKKRDGDPRKQLWRPFLDVVRKSRATIFVMENVPQLLGTPEHEEILEVSKEMGFLTESKILCAADYGVAQKRFRAFIIGCSFADPKLVFPPKKTHYNPSNGYVPDLLGANGYICNPTEWSTVRKAIADLPDPKGIELSPVSPPMDLHFGRTPTAASIERYKAIPEEGMNRFDLQKRARHLTPSCWIRKTSGGTDLFGRLWWDRPALTIRTEFFKPEKGRYLHPSKHRPITHREAARIQSFPDSFLFQGSKTEIAKQIGNAVPPLLAARVADCVYALWCSQEKQS